MAKRKTKQVTRRPNNSSSLSDQTYKKLASCLPLRDVDLPESDELPREIRYKSASESLEVPDEVDINSSNSKLLPEAYELNASYDRDIREYKLEIDWSQFDEPQIQTLIAILFRNIGYSIQNWHKADRSREAGADLVLSKSKDKIALAVKIKPKTSDRQQLSDLSKRQENRKIYVHIQTPSRIFHDSMDEYEGKVEFWDGQKLNEFFVKKDLAFAASLIFDNHKISNSIGEIRSKLLEIRAKCIGLKKKAVNSMDRSSILLLFRLKDDAVSLHKTNKNVITLFEKPINIKNQKLNEHFLKICMEHLDIMDSVLYSFSYYFDKFYTQNQDLVHNSMQDHIGKSAWLWLSQYRTKNTLVSLKKELKEAIEDGNLINKLQNTLVNHEEEKYWNEMSKNNDVWSAMSARVKQLTLFGSGVEAIIDDIIDEYAMSLTKDEVSER